MGQCQRALKRPVGRAAHALPAAMQLPSLRRDACAKTEAHARLGTTQRNAARSCPASSVHPNGNVGITPADAADYAFIENLDALI